MILPGRNFSFVFIGIVCLAHFAIAVLPGVDDFEPTEFLAAYCRKHGYPFEVHYVNNYDGYILQVHRIPAKDAGAPAVLVMHGLLGSSADWVIGDPKRVLAFMLHDSGYDVWLGNSRGNTFSRNHTTLSPADPAFWDFSWHEIGLNDCSAQIDYVRNSTKQEKIFYIGFSQGTTQFWVLMSLKPEYNDRIKFMMALAPVAFMGHVKGLARFLSPAAFHAREAYDENGYTELLSSSSGLRKTAFLACKLPVASPQPGGLCNVLFVLIAGPTEDADYTHLELYLLYTPAGCSSKQMLHYASNVNHPGHFMLYDYGKEKNLRHYNSTVPPSYPVHKITAPVGLYYSPNDWLAQPEDVELLRKRLPNLVEAYALKSKKINHLDFIIGKRIRPLLYERLVKQMKSFD